MDGSEQNQTSPGPVLFLQAYEKILSCCKEKYTPASLLKSIGLINTIAWREAAGETVTLDLLAQIFTVSKACICRQLACLKKLELVSIQKNQFGITSTHVIHSDRSLKVYLEKFQQSSIYEDDFFRSSNQFYIVSLFNQYALKIMHERRDTENPTFALQCMGFLFVIAWLNVQHGFVTRRMLSEALHMSENAFRPKIDYLHYLELIRLDKVQLENNIGWEYRIYAPDCFVEALGYWLTQKTHHEKMNVNDIFQNADSATLKRSFGNS